MQSQAFARCFVTVLIFGLLIVPLSGAKQAVAQETPDGIPSDSQRAEVTNHVDGDKFKVEIDGETEEVLLIAADAPELGNDDDLGECHAKEAVRRLKKLLPEGRTVYLERDDDDRDGKDRLLRYVWTERQGKPELVDERMISEGFATFKARDDNNRYDERFKVAEASAKKGKKGLWKSCGGGHVEITPEPERGTSDNPAAVGEAITKGGYEVTLVNAYFVEGFDILSPEPGNIFLVVEAIIKNVDDDTDDYNELYFSATDPDEGYTFDDTFLNPSAQPLGSGELGPGDIARGEVVLEVRADSERIRVKYETAGGIGGDALYWLATR